MIKFRDCIVETGGCFEEVLIGFEFVGFVLGVVECYRVGG